MTEAGNPPVVALLEPGYADHAAERAAIAPLGLALLPVPAAADAAAVLAGREVRAILVRERRVDARLMDACPGLRCVQRYGVGVDNVDLPAATARRIAVCNIPDYGAAQEVSDHAVALYLAVARRIVSRDGEVRRGIWGVDQAQPVPGHRGAVLGLVGFGRIARAAWARFRALGFARALVSDPALGAAEAAAHGVEPAPLERIFAEADAVSLHAPLTAATRHIVDAAMLARMKPTAVLVNASRGGLIDEPALAAALHEGRLFGAGIDVFETEPPAPDNPLLGAPNTVLTDHAGWYSEASVRALQQHAAEGLRRALSGETPQNWVNPWPEGGA
ncbi:C-terminal binding protein [Paralimibaculum aggregatum]|uniref:C-terminal binding protein n=1 Tax=Paralimibaculum aggregatum TaxID=3036245 RepID=A0ABQ6LTM6_9RHOB|nr:C-terminal binding protein [Limibaculum sp. NKW23]GMG85423.1 C-terminal binding protein [Limibaculum sp. NKW23]